MEDLKKLIAQAKAAQPSAADREEQRRSFAYGNTKIENHRITKAIVNEQATSIDKSETRHRSK